MWGRVYIYVYLDKHIQHSDTHINLSSSNKKERNELIKSQINLSYSLQKRTKSIRFYKTNPKKKRRNPRPKESTRLRFAAELRVPVPVPAPIGRNRPSPPFLIRTFIFPSESAISWVAVWRMLRRSIAVTELEAPRQLAAEVDRDSEKKRRARRDMEIRDLMAAIFRGFCGIEKRKEGSGDNWLKIEIYIWIEKTRKVSVSFGRHWRPLNFSSVLLRVQNFCPSQLNLSISNHYISAT